MRSFWLGTAWLGGVGIVGFSPSSTRRRAVFTLKHLREGAREARTWGERRDRARACGAEASRVGARPGEALMTATIKWRRRRTVV